jgi:small-conductance mechanosensitive channel
MKDLFNRSLEIGGEASLTVGNIMLFLLALVISWLLVKIVTRLLYRALRKRNIESGKVYGIVQIIKYVLYILLLIVALQFLKLNLGGLLLGASALLIGVGIGLQQIFYDLFSGFLMLLERKVQVGEFVEIDGMVGRVDRIDMRTSVVRNLDNISVIVPNSKLISENVINWSHNRGLARFSVPVGVAYGSNVQKVKKVLIECALGHEKVLKKPAPAVFFRSFGDSALQFDLLFWSRHFKEIEIVKSDLHFSIDAAFRENRITIAFPQIDVHMHRSI